MDTPGFGDSDGSDNKLIEEMMNILDNELGDANIIVLAIDGATPRFSSGLYDMLRQMSSIFGGFTRNRKKFYKCLNWKTSKYEDTVLLH